MGVEDFLRNGSLGIFGENLRNFGGFFVGILRGFWREFFGVEVVELVGWSWVFEAELRLR